MVRKALVCAATLITMVGPIAVEAQTPTWQDVQVADIQDMQGKFKQLAQAFEESHYDWRPMEGVRSVGRSSASPSPKPISSRPAGVTTLPQQRWLTCTSTWDSS